MTSTMKPRGATPLKIAIVEAGLKQIDLAAELEIDVSRFNLIVNGRVVATTEERRAIAKRLRRTQTSLF